MTATSTARRSQACVDLYWLPLGAGGPATVAWSGRLYEAIAARRDHRRPCDLYHSALQIHLGGVRFVIEMAPVWGNREPDRGVVGEGSVGLPWLGRSRYFRYETRRWPDGTIPDIGHAVASPQRLSTHPAVARRVLDLVPDFPTVTWGRDELGTGEMWNSNSLIAWLLASCGHLPSLVHLPARGRAPGWRAGLIVAARQTALGLPAGAVGHGGVGHRQDSSGRKAVTTMRIGSRRPGIGPDLRALGLFAVLTFALSWAWAWPLALSGIVVTRGDGWLTHFPALFGPAIAALVTMACTRGWTGVKDLLARMGRWRFPLRWWAVTLSPLAFLAVALIVQAVAGDLPGSVPSAGTPDCRPSEFPPSPL